LADKVQVGEITLNVVTVTVTIHVTIRMVEGRILSNTE